MLDLVELSPMARRKPTQLSGGQQQRVAVARALINRPDVLLLDEPLGALDLKLRRQMQIELKRIQVEVGTTFVHVTHDQEEAMTMADTVAVMNAGRIEQMGHPADIYELPRTVFVANFLGQSNLIQGTRSGTVRRRRARPGERAHVRRARPSAASPRGPRSSSACVPRRSRSSMRSTPTGSPSTTTGSRAASPTSSYTGVSTQYLVMTRLGPGADRLRAERRGRATAARWATRSSSTGRREHTFGLDGTAGTTVGVDPEVLDLEAVNQSLVATTPEA